MKKLILLILYCTILSFAFAQVPIRGDLKIVNWTDTLDIKQSAGKATITASDSVFTIGHVTKTTRFWFGKISFFNTYGLNGQAWRYNSSTNTLYWYDPADSLDVAWLDGRVNADSLLMVAAQDSIARRIKTNLPILTSNLDTGVFKHNGSYYIGSIPASFDTSANHNNLFLNQITSRTTFQLIIPLASKQIALTTDSVMNLSPNGTVKLSPKKTLSTYFRLYPLFTGVGTVSSLDSVKITIDSCGVYRSSSLIADDGTITISLAKSGRGWVSAGDDEARTWFYFKTDGTITLGSSDVVSSVNTDTDTYLCVFDNTGNSFKIRNRLGASKVITYEILVGK